MTSTSGVNVNVPEGFWQREVSHLPLPLTPATDSTFIPAVNLGTKAMLDGLSLLLGAFEAQAIGGWGYLRAVPYGGDITARIARCVEVIGQDTFYAYVQRWHDEWKPDLQRRAQEINKTDFEGLGDDALAERTRAAVRLLEDGLVIHFVLHGTNALTLGDLVFTSEELLGWDEAQTLELLAGLSEISTAPSRALAELADIARERQDLRALLARAADGERVEVSGVDPEFEAALARYVGSYGHRSLRYELSEPTLAELPELTLALVHDQLARPYDADAEEGRLARLREERRAKAHEILAARPESDRQRFERALGRAERFYPVREEKEFYDLCQPMASLRYCLLEVGRRLEGRGVISAQDDLFYLELGEALEALGAGGDLQGAIDSRRAARERAFANPGPPSYGPEPPPPPPMDALPPEARFANEAMAWLLDRIYAPVESIRKQPDGGSVSGIAASAGNYTGEARIVMGEDELDRIRPGDVLICPVTSAVWSIVFPKVGAIVTDSGGMLSHPAIIAREYRIPAVVGTGNATELVPDGRLVTVDGSRGTIVLA